MRSELQEPRDVAGAETPGASRPRAIQDRAASPLDIERASLRNFVVLAGYHVCMRIGWIFKTETIIMPAVLDLLSGQAWIRGCMPVLNRFGQSVPPLMANDWVKTRSRKKFVLARTTASMAMAFFVLALGWQFVGASSDPSAQSILWWAPWAYLAVYAAFFACTGLNQLAFNALQGKLVAPQRRGRLMWVSNLLGSACAIGFALWLLPHWLADTARFGQVFAFTATCFVAASLSALTLQEPRDDYTSSVRRLRDVWVNAWRTLKEDANFRLLAIAASLFGGGFLLFPHYQALGRIALNIQFRDLLMLVVIQNAGTAGFSMLIGPLADRRGNRSALRLLMFLLAVAPCLAVALAWCGEAASAWYSLVFLLVGMTPVTIRSFNNYALEIAGPADQPRYLSTLSLCFAAPIVASPLVGALIGLTGFAATFLIIAVLILIGWSLCWRLREPRTGSTTNAD